MILILRTDKAEAEIGLYDGQNKAAHFSWQADKQLSNQLHKKIADMLTAHEIEWQDLKGIIFYEGPGSFTGLRIGASLANTLSSELSLPVAQSTGKFWIKAGLDQLKSPNKKKYIVPNYGRPPHITKPKK